MTHRARGASIGEVMLGVLPGWRGVQVVVLRN